MTLEKITVNPAGQPTIRNLRLTVKRVVELATLYPDRMEFHQEYLELTEEDIRQALIYVSCHSEKSTARQQCRSMKK